MNFKSTKLEKKKRISTPSNQSKNQSKTYNSITHPSTNIRFTLLVMKSLNKLPAIDFFKSSAFQTYTSHPYLDSPYLSPGKVFTGLTLFNLLGVPLFLVPTVISAVTHARVSVTRLNTFLEAPEIVQVGYTTYMQ